MNLLGGLKLQSSTAGALFAGTALLFLGAPAANANTFIFQSGGPVMETSGLNAPGPGSLIDVSATLTLDSANQTITVSLLNLLAHDSIDISGIIQAIGAFDFTLSNPGSGVTSGFQAVTAAESGGTYLNISTSGTTIQTSPGSWGAGKMAVAAAGGTTGNLFPAVVANTYRLCVICGTNSGITSSGSPKGMLISGPNSSGAYPGSGGSLNNAHSPFLLASGDTYTSGTLAGKNSSPSWVLSLPANTLTSLTTVSSATFYFGSLPYEYQFTDNIPDTPEPASVLLMVSGLGLVAWFGRKHQARKTNEG